MRIEVAGRFVGQVLIYTTIVTNIGPNQATGVVVNDAVPEGTTFASASPTPLSAPTVGAGGTVVWNVGNQQFSLWQTGTPGEGTRPTKRPV